MKMEKSRGQSLQAQEQNLGATAREMKYPEGPRQAAKSVILWG